MLATKTTNLYHSSRQKRERKLFSWTVGQMYSAFTKVKCFKTKQSDSKNCTNLQWLTWNKLCSKLKVIQKKSIQLSPLLWKMVDSSLSSYLIDEMPMLSIAEDLFLKVRTTWLVRVKSSHTKISSSKESSLSMINTSTVFITSQTNGSQRINSATLRKIRRMIEWTVWEANLLLSQEETPYPWST